MSLQAYYDNVASNPAAWANTDADQCGCGGRGWFLSDLDTWHKCPVHDGLHPYEEEAVHYAAEEEARDQAEAAFIRELKDEQDAEAERIYYESPMASLY